MTCFMNFNFPLNCHAQKKVIADVYMPFSTFYNKGGVLALMLGYETYYYVCCVVIYYVILRTLCDILLGYDVLLSLNCS